MSTVPSRIRTGDHASPEIMSRERISMYVDELEDMRGEKHSFTYHTIHRRSKARRKQERLSATQANFSVDTFYSSRSECLNPPEFSAYALHEAGVRAPWRGEEHPAACERHQLLVWVISEVEVGRDPLLAEEAHNLAI
eukprot:CAMPEP_0115849082 /NCGR_PEP_ID=MMETSP0287-20121206/11264_1 /TAXON_ID=412157 /ORGANISM="Chrysochromulina rotalis, Strain UIO044" /LENGTH=137 /DNA_ID=CAMNT_0003303035 /DNA_START=289 /DNA_END=704 /DNA_ORIENTATION=+